MVVKKNESKDEAVDQFFLPNNWLDAKQTYDRKLKNNSKTAKVTPEKTKGTKQFTFAMLMKETQQERSLQNYEKYR